MGSPTPPTGSLRYQPALDGMRGVAVAAVLCFHAGFDWAVGGYLGVSTFFTLSGFLITSLLLVERHTTGRTDLKRFWSRRFRRLMPAAVLCLALVVVFGATVATSGQLDGLRAEVLAALAYVANWQLIIAGESYGDLFASPSPILHFWSLAIEEQFYLLFPLVMVGLFAVARRSRRRLAVGLAVLISGSVLATLVLQDASRDTIYYSTGTRAAELLAGALLAVVLVGRPRLGDRARTAVVAVGALALAASVALWATTELDESWLYEGGLPAYALLSAGVIAAAVQRGGPVRWLLSWEPLRLLGLISYGVYLFHWPIYLWLTPQRTGLDQWPLFALRLGVTLVVATVSFVAMERPIRTRQMLVGRQALVVAPLGLAAIAVLTLAITVPDVDQEPTFDQAEEILAEGDFSAPFIEDSPNVPEEAQEAAAAAPKPTVFVYGDSTAQRLALGVGGWAQSTNLVTAGRSITEIGCGLIEQGRYRFDAERDAPDDCASVQRIWASSLLEGGPDIALVLAGPWEAADWLLPNDGTWRHLGDPAFDEYVLDRIRAAAETLSSQGAVVYWVASPVITLGMEDGVPPAEPSPVSDPARIARFNELVDRVAVERPEQMQVLDLPGYLRQLPDGETDPSLRPDGVHFTWETAYQVTRDWLGPEILRHWQTDFPRPTTP